MRIQRTSFYTTYPGLFQEVDRTKWELPGGDSAAAGAAGDGQRQMEDSDEGRPSAETTQLPSSSAQHLQVHIGAHDYLVVVAAAGSRPPQGVGASDQDQAMTAAAEPEDLHAHSRISTIHAADFTYGRVEVRAKVASEGFSGFWLRPSEEGVVGKTPCARVAIAEVSGGE